MWLLLLLVAAVAAESTDESLLSSDSPSSSTRLPGSTESGREECVDLVDFCEELKTICIGTIIVDQLQQLQAITDEISKSTALPALQSAFPKIKEVEGSGDGSTETGSTKDPLENIDTKVIENSLPLIKESLPLIRESLPLIRESLPLIRQFLDPVYYSGDASTCQKKVTCKSCRECPKLRDAVTTLVESICPATCRVCGKRSDGPDAASNLVKLYM